MTRVRRAYPKSTCRKCGRFSSLQPCRPCRENERVVIHYDDGCAYIAPEGMTASDALRVLDANRLDLGVAETDG